MTLPIIRRATVDDAAVIYELICALAEFEKAPAEVKTSPAQIVETMFGDDPQAWAELIVDEDGVQGMALWFTTYSTWEGVYGIHLEDLYIRPSARGKGYASLLFQRLALIMEENNWGRLEWTVLTWNQAAIDVYQHMGGREVQGWYDYRMIGAPVKALAEQGRRNGVTSAQ